MEFVIVKPYYNVIYGDSFKEAVKNYAKMNYNIGINNLIIKDQAKYYDTKIKYYKQLNKNKIGIDVYPYNGPTPIVNSNGDLIAANIISPTIITTNKPNKIKANAIPVATPNGISILPNKIAVLPNAIPILPNVGPIITSDIGPIITPSLGGPSIGPIGTVISSNKPLTFI